MSSVEVSVWLLFRSPGVLLGLLMRPCQRSSAVSAAEHAQTNRDVPCPSGYRKRQLAAVSGGVSD